jgi:hypothetical protein
MYIPERKLLHLMLPFWTLYSSGFLMHFRYKGKVEKPCTKIKLFIPGIIFIFKDKGFLQKQPPKEMTYQIQHAHLKEINKT